MQALEKSRKTLDECSEYFDKIILPAFEKADRSVSKYGFSSYFEMAATMMEKAKTIIRACKSIKAQSTIEEEIEDMDDLLEVYEPMVNDMLPNIQNALVDALPIEIHNDRASGVELYDDLNSVNGLMRLMTV